MKKVMFFLMAVCLIFTNTTVIKAEKKTNNEGLVMPIQESFLRNSVFEKNMSDFALLNTIEDEKASTIQISMEKEIYNEFSSIENVQIEAGENFAVLLKENGTVWTWGDNQYGQLGNGKTESNGVPQKIKELTDIIYVDAGATFAFAINKNGEVFAWGDNRYAQLGDGTCIQRTKPVQISRLTEIKKISSGYYHSVALKKDGTVYFWGNPNMNDSTHSSQFKLYPEKVDLPIIKDISSGKNHIVTLSEAGCIYTWGENSNGQLGSGVFCDVVLVPQKIDLATNITKIESGMSHNIALDDSGCIYAWGSNFYGQLGDGTNQDRCAPIKIESIDEIKDVIAGYNHTIFIKNNDGIYTCGNNEYGQLGVGTTENSSLPKKISNDSESISISGGLNHTLEVDSEGDIYVWGLNSSKQLGNSDNIPITNHPKPTQVCNIKNIDSIASGMYHSLALGENGTVWSWGYNSHSQLGDGSVINRDIPQKVIDDVKSVSAGYYHSVALKKDGTVWAWGFNGFAQIGKSENRNYVPTQVSGLTDITAIAASSYHTLALKSDGTVWMWGRKNYETSSSNVYNNIITPIQIEGLTNIKAIAAGYYTNFAIKEDGTVYAWGINNLGQFGDGTMHNSDTPVKLNVTNIKAVSAGPYHTIMLNENGEVFGFGDNGNYQYGNINERKLDNITSIAAGQNYSLMLNENGRVLSCGYNNNGQLGNGTYKRNMVPIEIGGLKDVKDIAAGYGHSIALKNDGTVMTWGNNGSGQLGTGKKFIFKSPCLFGGLENAKLIGVDGQISGSIRHISGQEWYKLDGLYDASFKISVNQGYEIEVYKNNVLQDTQSQVSFELNSTDNVYIKVMKKEYTDEDYTLSIFPDTSKKIIETVHKDKLVKVNGSEYYINLYDNRYLYKDDIRLTNYPVIAVCTNGDKVFVAGDNDIFQVNGTTLKSIVNGVQAYFIAADLNNIYFSDWYNGGKIYYSKIGSNKYSKLSDDVGTFLKVDDTYLHYYDVKKECKQKRITKIQ